MRYFLIPLHFYTHEIELADFLSEVAPIFPQMKISIITLTTSLVLIPISYLNSANAADCIKACVDVYTQDGQLIFEARKGSGPKASTAPKPKPKAVVKPKPVTKPKVAAKPRVAAPKKKVAQKKRAPVAVAATSLSDRISKALPTTGIAYQPNFQPLINVPVYFWSDMPAVFRSKVDLIGEVIDVTMRPSFLWSYGDGTFFATTKFGAPFPSKEISHTYSHAGTYVVTMLATWGGTWTHNGIMRAITGEIRKLSVATVRISTANTPLSS